MQILHYQDGRSFQPPLHSFFWLQIETAVNKGFVTGRRNLRERLLVIFKKFMYIPSSVVSDTDTRMGNWCNQIHF